MFIVTEYAALICELNHLPDSIKSSVDVTEATALASLPAPIALQNVLYKNVN